MNTMSLMRQFTIRLRMLGAIAMVLGMFALVGLVGFVGGSRIQSLNVDFMEHSLHETSSVSALRQHLAQPRGVADDHAVTLQPRDARQHRGARFFGQILARKRGGIQFGHNNHAQHKGINIAQLAFRQVDE